MNLSLLRPPVRQTRKVYERPRKVKASSQCGALAGGFALSPPELPRFSQPHDASLIRVISPEAQAASSPLLVLRVKYYKWLNVFVNMCICMYAG